MCSKGDKENIPMERAFKATPEHWALVVEDLEAHSSLIKCKFSNATGDNAEAQRLWQKLATQLNSLGYGSKTVSQWQQAIGRWKSKIKAKATNINVERRGTGGGEATTPPLSEIEERLMGVLGWRSVTGDSNIELGMGRNQLDVQQPTTSKAATGGAEGVAVLDDTAPPPLTLRKLRAGGEASRVIASPPTKRKVPQSTEKSRKIVSLHKMHQDNMAILQNIDANIAALGHAVVDLAAAVREHK